MNIDELGEYLQVLEEIKKGLDKLKHTKCDVNIIGFGGKNGEGTIRISIDLSLKESSSET